MRGRKIYTVVKFRNEHLDAREKGINWTTLLQCLRKFSKDHMNYGGARGVIDGWMV